MLITVVNVDITTTPAKGKGRPWSTAEVAYKNERGEIKSWKVISFANPQVFDAIKEAKNGDQFDITLGKTTGKDGQEYTAWTSATKADGATAVTGNGPAAKPVGKVVGSNYETAEERAFRQRLIVRQSSLTAALGYYNHPSNHKANVTEQDVMALADQFSAWVFAKPDLFDEPNDNLDDIPY
jgi:hypothetical protein